MPHVELPNMILYDQDQIPRYRINANSSSGTVTWSTRLVGTWYTPLDFRAYPFDHQHLLLELAIADSQSAVAGLRWEHVAKLNNTAHTKGADMSGWRVKWGKAKVYDSRTCMEQYNVTAPSYSAAPGNPSAALLPALYTSIRLEDRYFANNAGHGTSSPSGCGNYPTMYDEGRALYGPVVLVADIMVKRVTSYYIMTNLLPVLIISLVTFVVYYMPCNALNDRMVVTMTLFLSLTAMQFVFDFPPANYLNALQQVVLIAYIMMLMSCGESMLVNWIATLPQTLKNKRTCVSKYSTLLRRTAGVTARAAFDKSSTCRPLPCSAAAAPVGEGFFPCSYTGAALPQKPQQPHRQAHHYAQVLAAGGDAPPSPGYPVAAARSFESGGRASMVRVGSRKRSGPSFSASRRRVAATAAAAIADGCADTGGAAGKFAASRCTTLTRAQTPPPALALAPTRRRSASMDSRASASGAPTSSAGGAGAGASSGGDVVRGSSAASDGAAPAMAMAEEALRGVVSTVSEGPPITVADQGAINIRLGSQTALYPLPEAPHWPSAHPAPPPLPRAALSSPLAAVPPLSPYSYDHTPISTKGPLGRGRIAGLFAALLARLLAWVTNVLHAPRRFYEHCKEDPEFACITEPNSMKGPPRRGRVARLFAALLARLQAWVTKVLHAPRRFYEHCKEDPEFAWYVAVRIDKWFCVFSLATYVVVISVLLWVQTMVGDHRLMLGDAPGNM
ncbi:hypothetical protein GPECTOR_24g233 [Gonium pectorale]|uniref:Neurotransmitter-gated ion-channel transmembrane domain-containing protein n=1 Tax=Gonium pectorale TaxID=33097 RepID=A0A150GGM8_GONPE|nr:hypothetical protein GPECTOR_24g233 [Gonium pectorale]|eukprot:KXZ48943.1 hypothetical protein GPECTOR_24g233 [Gonium pectorale]